MEAKVQHAAEAAHGAASAMRDFVAEGIQNMDIPDKLEHAAEATAQQAAQAATAMREFVADMDLPDKFDMIRTHVSSWTSTMTGPFQVTSTQWTVLITTFFFCQMVNYLSMWYLRRRSDAYNKLSRVDQIEWATRISSTFHAVTVVFLTGFWSFHFPELALGSDNVVFVLSKYSAAEATLGISAGYFCSDLVWVLRYGIEPVWHSATHHILGGLGAFYCMACHIYGWFPHFFMLTTEVTNPLGNWLWINKKRGIPSPFVGIAFTVSWLIFRVLNNSVVVYRVWQYWHDITSVSYFYQILLACNLGFLVIFNVGYFVFSVLNAGHPMALPPFSILWDQKSRDEFRLTFNPTDEADDAPAMCQMQGKKEKKDN